MPVRARRSITRERLPSSRERASFHPLAETSRKLICLRDVPRTGSPSLRSCPASDGASSFLPASALLLPPRGLATPRWARRAMRPIDFCHLNSMRVPAPRTFPARCRGLHRVGASRTLGTVRLDRRTGWFTPPATALADRQGPRSHRSLRTSATRVVSPDWSAGFFVPRSPSRPSL